MLPFASAEASVTKDVFYFDKAVYKTCPAVDKLSVEPHPQYLVEGEVRGPKLRGKMIAQGTFGAFSPDFSKFTFSTKWNIVDVNADVILSAECSGYATTQVVETNLQPNEIGNAIWGESCKITGGSKSFAKLVGKTMLTSGFYKDPMKAPCQPGVSTINGYKMVVPN